VAELSNILSVDFTRKTVMLNDVYIKISREILAFNILSVNPRFLNILSSSPQLYLPVFFVHSPSAQAPKSSLSAPLCRQLDGGKSDVFPKPGEQSPGQGGSEQGSQDFG